MEFQDTGIMLYFYHQLQVFGLMSIGYLTWILSGEKDIDRHNLSFFSALTIFYHISLFYLNTTPLLYFWFWYSIGHYLIHIREPRTIAESQKLSYDEIWHFVQEHIVLYYLYSNGRPYEYYLCTLIVYYLLFFAAVYNERFISALYFWASTMTIVFLISLRDNGDYFTLSIPFIIIHLLTSWVVTRNNTIGRLFLDVNIAGCTFTSEAIMLYLAYNGVY